MALKRRLNRLSKGESILFKAIEDGLIGPVMGVSTGGPRYRLMFGPCVKCGATGADGPCPTGGEHEVEVATVTPLGDDPPKTA